ncbi:hypothetical protein OHB54_46285 (plasmid) [Streptomyces sp. NBC_01007]|nr:hypothetical protein OHB54_46285 [Streptomyces sp. NBC_01007]
MNTEFLSSVDREKSPLLDADFDAVRIAAALLNSPHILTASAEPGDDTVRFTGQAGTRYTLTLQSAEPTDDDQLLAPVLTEALAAAILNSPHFVAATADSPRKDTITVQTRDQTRYLLALDVDHRPVGGQDVPSPAAAHALRSQQEGIHS